MVRRCTKCKQQGRIYYKTILIHIFHLSGHDRRQCENVVNKRRLLVKDIRVTASVGKKAPRRTPQVSSRQKRKSPLVENRSPSEPSERIDNDGVRQSLF